MSYWRVNEAFRRRMVYHVGVECGLFVEINYMVNAMLYCLAHRIRFQLYSDDANFCTGIGWREYFLPVCEEVHEPFHHQYNFHRPPSWRRILKLCMRQKAIGPIVWKLKSVMKTVVGHLMAFQAYKEYVLLGQDVPSDPDQYYCIPELGIDGSYTDAYGLLARMVWQPQPELQQQIAETKLRLSLPQVYSGIQIRGGDKAKEARLITGKRIIETLRPIDGECIFALADNYDQLEIVRNEFPQLRIVSLCRPEDRGYCHHTFCTSDPKEKRAAIIRLIVSVDLLLHARRFVGSITTGPSVFVMKQRVDDPLVQAVDCPKKDMASSLCLTIDVRAAISKKNMQKS